jgi:hypothetical protein
VTQTDEARLRTMLIIPGITRVGGAYDEGGLLDRDSAREYARRRGRLGRVINVAETHAPSGLQIRRALDSIETDPTIDSLYGFSGGGYSLRDLLRQLTTAQRDRIKLVVVLGVESRYAAPTAFRGPWELVWRDDPPEGHMAGPRVLLASLGPEPAPPAPSPTSRWAAAWSALAQIFSRGRT